MNSFQMKNQNVRLASRKQKVVTCPYCWTDQRSSRNFCYCCGAAFIFLDEAGSPSGGTAIQAALPSGCSDVESEPERPADCSEVERESELTSSRITVTTD